MQYLRLGTATTLKVGPFLDAFDGVTPESELADIGVEISKGAGAFGPRHSSTAVAHDSEGWYAIHLDTMDTDTTGLLKLKAQDAATHLPVWESYVVVAQNVYDSLVLGSDNLCVNVV